jgi:hypothetical protein
MVEAETIPITIPNIIPGMEKRSMNDSGLLECKVPIVVTFIGATQRARLRCSPFDRRQYSSRSL